MLLYLDTCALNRPFDDRSQLAVRLEILAKLDIQDKIKKSRYRLAWSYVLDDEINANPCDDQRNALTVWEKQKSAFQPKVAEVLSLGKQYQDLGLKTNDALHLACSVLLKCDYFITTDKKILNKKIDAVRVISPLEFIKEMEEVL